MSTFRIARRNLGRNVKRTALALGAIMLAQAAVLLMDGLLKGYGDAMIDAYTGPMRGHVQLHAPKFRQEQSMDLVLEGLAAKLSTLRQVAGVESVGARIYAPSLIALGQQGYVGVVVGLDPARESGPRGLLGEAKDAAKRLGENEVLVGAGLAQRMGVSRGDELAIVGQGADGSIANDLYRVVGTVQSPVDMVQSTGVVMNLDAAQLLFVMPDQAHEITVHGADPNKAAALAETIAGMPAFAGVEVKTWRELAPELITMLDLTDLFTWVLLLLVFVASASGVANTMLMATFERNHELGMLLALGCSPGRIVAMITLEAVMLGFVGIMLGTGIGVVGNALLSLRGIDLASIGGAEGLGDLTIGGLNYGLRIVPRTSWVSATAGVSAVMVTSLLAALWPAVHAARLQPVEAMRA